MNNKSKTKKSASIVGSTLASSYFHGDASCYGALCKMAQPYLMRYPLIEGQGSLGTQEANGMQASSRYTEAKPSQYADLMMNDFKKNVVPTVETYNGEYMEPVVLPSIFPNAIVNGREAIGISMSHNSLPANLTEVCDGIVAFIKSSENITLDELMSHIKGPDFPLGGTVINSRDIKEAYRTGHSKVSLKVRGDYEIKGQDIIFTSIPYRTYRNKIKEQITKNIDELDGVIEDFNDESSLGNNRLIFTVKKGVNPENAVNKLFAYTDLQTTLSYNMNFIVNGTPKLCSLIDLIKAYVNHQNNVMIKAAEFDKEKAEARAHILEGLLLAVDKIDEVIKIIKSSENKATAAQSLMSFLSIDEIQANAILDMKLARLTKINKQELVDELKRV
jgi:DNA gyrase subunit A